MNGGSQSESTERDVKVLDVLGEVKKKLDSAFVKDSLLSQLLPAQLLNLCRSNPKLAAEVLLTDNSKLVNIPYINQLLQQAGYPDITIGLTQLNRKLSAPSDPKPSSEPKSGKHFIMLLPSDHEIECGIEVKEAFKTETHIDLILIVKEKVKRFLQQGIMPQYTADELLDQCILSEEVARIVENADDTNFQGPLALNILLQKAGKLYVKENESEVNADESSAPLVPVMNSQSVPLFFNGKALVMRDLTTTETYETQLDVLERFINEVKKKADPQMSTEDRIRLDRALSLFAAGKPAYKEIRYIPPKNGSTCKKKKFVKPTHPDLFELESQYKHLEPLLQKNQQKAFPTTTSDELLSKFCSRLENFSIERKIRMFLWATSEEIQEFLTIPTKKHKEYRQIKEVSTRAYKHLESLSIILSYFNPCYAHNTDMYSEECVFEMCCLDQFPGDLQTLSKHKQNWKIMETKEKNRRLKDNDDVASSLAKAFGYIDGRVGKIRTNHKMAKLYFFLSSYLTNLAETLDFLFHISNYWLMCTIEGYLLSELKK